MTQKKKAYLGKINQILFFALFFFIYSQWFKVYAQSLPSVDPGSIGAETAVGTPVNEILSALENGGIATKQSLAELAKPESNAETSAAPEVAASGPDTSGEAPVALNSDSLKFLESQGGITSKPDATADNPTVFNLATRFLEKVIFRSDAEFAKRPTFDDGLDISGTPTFDKDTAGYAIIKKGNQSVVIDFDSAYDVPPIVTASLSLQQYKDADVRAAAEDLLLVSDVKYIVTDVTKKGFEIMMDRHADSDIPFSWHALAVQDPQTSKKEGDNLDSGNIDNSDTDLSVSKDENLAPTVPAVPSSGSRSQNQAALLATPSGNFSLTAGDASAGQTPDNGQASSNSKQ